MAKKIVWGTRELEAFLPRVRKRLQAKGAKLGHGPFVDLFLDQLNRINKTMCR